MQRAERIDILSGIVNSVLSEQDGSFWVSTAFGVAHCRRPVWQVPAHMPALDEPIHGIAEDAAGRLWFVGRTSALLLANGTWKVYPYP